MKTRIELYGGLLMGVIVMLILASFDAFKRPEDIGLITYYVLWFTWVNHRAGARWTRQDVNLIGGTIGCLVIAAFLPNPANNVLLGVGAAWWLGYRVYLRRTARRETTQRMTEPSRLGQAQESTDT